MNVSKFGMNIINEVFTDFISLAQPARQAWKAEPYYEP